MSVFKDYVAETTSYIPRCKNAESACLLVSSAEKVRNFMRPFDSFAAHHGAFGTGRTDILSLNSMRVTFLDSSMNSAQSRVLGGAEALCVYDSMQLSSVLVMDPKLPRKALGPQDTQYNNLKIITCPLAILSYFLQ
jgi:hypothetical protein